LDEPFSALDPLTRWQLQDHLASVLTHYKPTMVLVTHDMEEALALANRVVVLNGPPGRIVGDFEPDVPEPKDRTGAILQAWKRRLMKLLAEGHRRPASGAAGFQAA
jgi:sulfonate transport system ATP-binding protein